MVGEVRARVKPTIFEDSINMFCLTARFTRHIINDQKWRQR